MGASQDEYVEGRVTVYRKETPGEFQVHLLGSLVSANSRHSADISSAIAALRKGLSGTILDYKQDGGALELTYDARPKMAPQERLYAYWAALGEYALNQLKQDPRAFGKLSAFGDIRIPYHVNLGHEAAVGQLIIQIVSPTEYRLTFTVCDYPQFDPELARTRIYHHFPTVGINVIDDRLDVFVEF